MLVYQCKQCEKQLKKMEDRVLSKSYDIISIRESWWDKYWVLHLEQSNSRYRYRLGDEQLEKSGSAERNQEMLVYNRLKMS